MERAIGYFTARGWRVEDVSATSSYDLHCTREDGEELRVEVKGTTGDGSQVLLTPNEVEHAREQFPHVALFVVAAVEVSAASGSDPVATGGAEQVWLPWAIDEGRLIPVGFAYSVPSRTARS
jgi:hypothetical protein